MPSEVHLYELIDPRAGNRFYIGVTNNQKRRQGEHAGEQCASTRKVAKDLRTAGLRLEMVKLATCPSRNLAEELEAALAYYRKHKPGAAMRWRQRTMPPRHGAAWSNADDKALRDGQDAGKTVREMATLLQRSRGSIRSRLNKMA